ncbi:hypothetical protein ARMSODRAFT_541798 [Armillaria solidipes]|uniref:Secreted protein n=1 Tax=Armillaria solidipes TaxID=1076256 RepID=A0A2H3BFN3_9AGAR|nr:hypothetical protein ARMSODRAFT_541798 [Armillaria solidipes]
MSRFKLLIASLRRLSVSSAECSSWTCLVSCAQFLFNAIRSVTCCGLAYDYLSSGESSRHLCEAVEDDESRSRRNRPINSVCITTSYQFLFLSSNSFLPSYRRIILAITSVQIVMD